ncbi:unnamed protein product [Mytilus edulis]|uniref:CRAL-TRIO domain-containing protein n=1 Tax=Mytilus edulis TaxID=6550 RepID=A0A8S3U364_MYTED|nr:unnamed protein product [Mytilus edulis]
MQLVRENSIKSVALYPIHSTKRSYPVKEGAHLAIKGAHLAIRTIRRFLEKYGDDIETIIFCCNEESIDAYLKILPLYFPRNETEEKIAVTELPLDIGNEDGEPVIPERQIRIMDKPTLAAMRKSSLEGFEETVDLNKEFATSTIVEVGRHPFAKMEENPDTHKKSHMYGKTTDEQKEKDNKRRYERYLKRAKTEDLTDIAALKCLYRTGTDKKSSNHELSQKIYCVLDEKYKKNLKAFYVVHPTWWSKLTTWYFTTFTASDLKNKVYNLKGVQYLYGTISPDQLDVPSFVINYDTEINGFRYYVPPEQEEATGL